MTDTNPEFDYQQPQVNEAADKIQEMQQGMTASPNDVNAIAEQEAFKTYVNQNNVEVPENFSDVDSWFTSLKEAQKNYTQGQQENAELRKQMAEQNAQPTPQPEPEVQPEVSPVDMPDAELRIPEAEAPPEEEPAPLFQSIEKSDWDQWAYEIATTGEIMEQTMQEIQTKTGLSPEMINDFVAGQKAKMRESYGNSAKVVGGKENLQNMLQWASQNLSEQERFAINHGFSNKAMRETTLRGLQARYMEATGNSPKAQEPAKVQNKVNVASTQQALTGYKTMREFRQDRSNPRFNMEPDFRAAVEERMMKTDFNYIPE